MASSSRRNAKGSDFPMSGGSNCFFKVVSGRSLQEGRLEIPPHAVEKFGRYISESNTLNIQVADGSKRRVKVMRCGDKIWLGKGWPEFAHTYSIQQGCFLFFSYGGVPNHFGVRVFQRDALEMEMDGSTSSDDDDDSAQCLSYSSSEDGCQLLSTDHEDEETDQFEESVQILDVSHIASRGKFKRPSRSGPNTEELLRRSLLEAQTFKSKNPFLIIKMQPTYLSNTLKLRASFIKQHVVADGIGYVNLQNSEGKCWTVTCSHHVYLKKASARFFAGWRAFNLQNHLKVGDTCVFEVIDRVTFKVHIFRG